MIDRTAYVGLHVTGLLFGSLLIASILVGVTFLAWPAPMVLFCGLGIAILPDSIAGLRSHHGTHH